MSLITDLLTNTYLFLAFTGLFRNRLLGRVQLSWLSFVQIKWFLSAAKRLPFSNPNVRSQLKMTEPVVEDTRE